ncbi:MAG TPA: hypothetical protein VKV26_07485 [Dehalococcoidia bacterium]|nr:hypothetical protein [Dehalococcoidia bacterium]
MSGALAYPPASPSSDELHRAAAAQPPAPPADADVVEAYLARLEATLAARVDQQVAAQSDASGQALVRLQSGLTKRIAASLAIGIPLVGAAGSIAGRYGNGQAAVAGIIAVLVAIVGLNVYYTEVEKDLEKEGLRNRRQP